MIREMTKTDWERVSEIYKQGLLGGKSTFNTECPSFEEWDKGHIKECRFVYEEEGEVVGWIAISPTSSRSAYRGCVEMSVYVDENYRGKGIGTKLIKKLIEEATNAGYWSIYSAIFSINEASIKVHKKCGFREIGYRERIAKDRFGNWQNTTLMEYRVPLFEVKESNDYEVIKDLFKEYSRIKGAEGCFVSFDKELSDLGSYYAGGATLLGFEDKNPIACIAIKKIDDDKCEGKRLFIKPEHRGKGYARKMLNAMLKEAKKLGFKELVFTTRPDVMAVGYGLYKRMGFEELKLEGGVAYMRVIL